MISRQNLFPKSIGGKKPDFDCITSLPNYLQWPSSTYIPWQKAVTRFIPSSYSSGWHQEWMTSVYMCTYIHTSMVRMSVFSESCPFDIYGNIVCHQSSPGRLWHHKCNFGRLSTRSSTSGRMFGSRGLATGCLCR